MMLVVDDFAPNIEEIHALAKGAAFYDYKAHDGEVYKRVFVCDIPGIKERLEEVLGGPVTMFLQAFRLNYDGELPNHAVHSDAGWGTKALVLYLSEKEGTGTAFWKHKQTGATSISMSTAPALLPYIAPDWNNVEAWEQTDMVQSKYNRALIYDGQDFHSRWPFEAYGKNIDDGRLIVVGFFTLGDIYVKS